MRKLHQAFGNVAYGAFSDSNNYATETNNFGETAFGILNKSTIDPDNFTSRDVVKSSKATLFSIGNGTEEERKNVIEIKGNGDVYINGVAGYTGTDTDEAGNIAEEFQGVHDSLDSIHMQKDDDSDLVYTLIVDGEERGTINIPKDQFLEDVNYDDDTKELVFIFVTSDENNKEVRINIGNLVDIYSAGNGLSLTEGQFAIKLDPSTESYITVGADGLKVSGLDAKFDTLTQKDTEQDERIQTAETDIDALQSDLSALKGDGEGSIGNQIQTAVDALKGGVSESYDTLKKIEDNIVSTNGKFDEYLPLTGGTVTGVIDTLGFDSDVSLGEYYTGLSDEGFFITQDSNKGTRVLSITRLPKGEDTPADGSAYIAFSDNHSNITLGITRDHIRFTEPKANAKYLEVNSKGVVIEDKTASDLLHAAGGTTTLKTINNTSLLGSGNIEVPTTESIQDITGSNTYTGTNYISKETNLTDAVIQLDEEIKATNDNLALEHANAEATYVKKAGDTMTGDLTVPNIVVTSSGDIDGRKLKVSNTGIDVLAPTTGTAYADAFLRVKDSTGENTIFTAFGVFSDSNVVGEGNQMAYVGGDYDAPTLSVFNSGLVGIGKSVGNPPTEKLDVNGNVKATKFIGPLQGNAATATKATKDANGANIASTYSKLDTTPFAGSKEHDEEYPAITDWLPSQRSFIGTFKGTSSADDWTTVISARHRNGDRDGNDYGIYIANKTLSHDSDSLRWNQQVTGVWQGEKVILDSANYTDYVPTLDEITTQVTAKLVDGAPETLDTLNELAAALGDDPNFATTVTNQIASKQDKLVSGTSIKTIDGQTLLGSGDITIPAPTVNAASGTKTIWTGTQSEYDGVTSKDANTLYFITEG